MYNEEDDQYTNTDDLNNGESVMEYEDDEGEFLKITKDQVFGSIDYTKRKSKIACTVG